MVSDFRLGAYLKGTETYIKPGIAQKKDDKGVKNEWTCPVCKTDADLKKGTIKAHHFAHRVKKSCSYFERPGESDLHKAAKEEIRNRYEGGAQFKVVRNCSSCRCPSNILDTSLLNGKRRATKEDSYDPTNKRLHSDVSLYHDDTLTCIVEILNTHKTEQRPEPWVEINAVDVIQNTDISDNITFYCKRSYICNICERKAEERLAEQNRIRAENERIQKEKQEKDRLERLRWIEEADIRAKLQERIDENRFKRLQEITEKNRIFDKELAEAKLAADKELAEKAKQEWDEKYERERLASGYDTFYWACHNGNIDDVTRLLETIDVNRKAKDGRTALMTACEEGHADLVRLLLQRGAQINTTMTSWDYNGTTALDFAKRREHTHIVSLIEEALQDIPRSSQ